MTFFKVWWGYRWFRRQWSSEEGVGSPELQVLLSHISRCCEWDWGSPEQQQELLTAEPPLQHGPVMSSWTGCLTSKHRPKRTLGISLYSEPCDDCLRQVSISLPVLLFVCACMGKHCVEVVWCTHNMYIQVCAPMCGAQENMRCPALPLCHATLTGPLTECAGWHW